MNTVQMRSPEGETREVEAPSEELACLMNAGWEQVKDQPPAEPEGVDEYVTS